MVKAVPTTSVVGFAVFGSSDESTASRSTEPTLDVRAPVPPERCEDPEALPPAGPDMEAVLDAAALAAITAEILATAATIAAAESEGLTGVLRKGDSIKVGESTSDSSTKSVVAMES